MSNLKALKNSSIAAAVLLVQSFTVGAANADSTSHLAVSQKVASSSSYATPSASGFKWGDRQTEQRSRGELWTKRNNAASGFKWVVPFDAEQSTAGAYADTSKFVWGESALAEETGFKWGIRSYADQTGFKWGIRSHADQAGFKWGIRSYADQTGFKWGIRSYADQAGFKWGIRSYADQAGFKWGIRSYSHQTGFKWGIR